MPIRDSYLLHAPLGAILVGRQQFLKTVIVQNDNEQFSIELPGQISRCGGASAFAIKPWARVISRPAGYRRMVVVTAAVDDEHGLDQALVPLQQRMASHAPTGFGIRFGSRLTFAEVFDALERNGSSCGCEESEEAATLPGTLSVGLAWDDDDEWSGPVAARLRLLWSYGPEDGVFFFDCHSIWSGLSDRRTDCEEKTACPSPRQCMCKDDNSNWRFWCKGWHFCICH